MMVFAIYFISKSATNEGPWLAHYAKLASIEINDDAVTIHNFRRARYDESGATQSVSWSNKTVDLKQLESVWYGISIFAEPGLAHTFLSFNFVDSEPVVISVEARMRPDQSYHPLTGALANYHLIYVVADEQDIIGVRVNKRAEQVFFMPINVDISRQKRMFLDMAQRVNSLVETPQFYNTFTSNCTNSIMKDTKVPAWQYYFDPRIILPGFSDRIAFEYGVLEQGFPLEVIRQAALLPSSVFDETVPEFSDNIRANFYRKLSSGTE